MLRTITLANSKNKNKFAIVDIFDSFDEGNFERLFDTEELKMDIYNSSRYYPL